MVKTIKLTNKQSFKIDTTIWWLFIYRQQFGRDILPDLLPFIEALLKINASFIAPNGETGEMTTAQYLQALAKDEVLEEALISLAVAESITIYQIAWALAKNADDSIPSPHEWIKSFKSLPVDRIGKEVITAVIESTISEKNAKSLLAKILKVA